MNMSNSLFYLQWIVFLVHLVGFNLAWLIGLRSTLKNKGYFSNGTAFAGLLLTLETFYFLFTNTNKFYVLLITPVICYLLAGTGLLQIILSIPIIGSILTIITKIYASIVTFGIKAKQNTFQEDFNKMFKDLK